MHLGRLALAIAAPLMLVSCVLSPGRFVSTLHIAKDRSFTFTYAGEVILVDPQAAMREGAAAMSEGGASAAAEAKPAQEAAKAESARSVAEGRAIAESLAKEVGYQAVEYLGNHKFRVDYAMTGRLDRSFVYPVNLDAKSIVPWVAVEVRKDGTARVKAIAFGDMNDGMDAMGKPSGTEKERNGTFTLTTDADLVMHNNEDGAEGKRVVWTVTPTSKTVPTAVVRF
jgi:hypothetical protein